MYKLFVSSLMLCGTVVCLVTYCMFSFTSVSASNPKGLEALTMDDRTEETIHLEDTGDNSYMITEDSLSKLNYSKLSNTKLDKEFKSLTPNEYRLMLRIMSLGIKDDLSYTLAAIAWKESMFGRWNVNLSDGKKGSYGPFHILLEYSLKRNKVSGSKWDESRLVEKHLHDLEFTTNEAILVLKNFEAKSNCNLKCAVASYNAGTNGNKKNKGMAYADDVFKRVAYLKKVVTLPNYHNEHFTILDVEISMNEINNTI